MGLFKAYDIRGIYGAELTEEFASRLGSAVIAYTHARNVVIGYDPREGNLKLFSALSKAITDAGADVIHIGIVSRPMLNWVVWKHGYDLGIIISASHNPKEYNGFKFVTKGGVPLCYDNGLSQVERMMGLKAKKSPRKGKIISLDYIDDYVSFLSSHLTKDSLKRIRDGFSIVADASNGAAGEIIRRFFERNGIEYKLLFADPDGRFPCHNPNPLDDSALIVLSKEVMENKADFGFIVDPDADRIRFVDEKGNMIDNSYIAALVARYMLSKRRDAAVVHDLISRRILSETVRRNHGKDIVSRVGYAFIIAEMKKHRAIYGAEMSGHNYFGSMNYLDSAMMMLVNVINMLSGQPMRMSTLVKPLGRYHDLGELDYKASDGSKERIVESILAYYKKNKQKLGVKKISTLDGVSVILPDVWLNIRPSNTEPVLRLRIEGKSQKRIEKVKKDIEKFIL